MGGGHLPIGGCPGAERIPEEVYNSLRYFHEYKGDITRTADWDKYLPLIRKRHPELVHAVEQLDIAGRTLDAIVKGLP